jgi:hypothetical protein
MSIFDNERMTNDLDWKDKVDMMLNKHQKEIEALRIEINHLREVNKNIKIDVERAIKKCLNTKDTVNRLP